LNENEELVGDRGGAERRLNLDDDDGYIGDGAAGVGLGGRSGAYATEAIKGSSLPPPPLLPRRRAPSPSWHGCGPVGLSLEDNGSDDSYGLDYCTDSAPSVASSSSSSSSSLSLPSHPALEAHQNQGRAGSARTEFDASLGASRAGSSYGAAGSNRVVKSVGRYVGSSKKGGGTSGGAGGAGGAGEGASALFDEAFRKTEHDVCRAPRRKNRPFFTNQSSLSELQKSMVSLVCSFSAYAQFSLSIFFSFHLVPSHYQRRWCCGDDG
jgi:hypothetical protein